MRHLMENVAESRVRENSRTRNRAELFLREAARLRGEAARNLLCEAHLCPFDRK